MSSRFLAEYGTPLLGFVLLAGLSTCDRSHGAEPTAADRVGNAAGSGTTVATTTLFPGGGHAPPVDPRGRAYAGDATHVANGRRYFVWYNCAGCHFNGGGGIGPALMDQTWIYGGRIDQIYQTLVEGRPNGMPSWRGKLSDEQLWEIAAYVESMSAPDRASGTSAAQPPLADEHASGGHEQTP